MEEKLRRYRLSRKISSELATIVEPMETESNSVDQEEAEMRTSHQPGNSGPTVDRQLEALILVLKVVLWCLSMALFVVLEFGAVFFVCSIFYFIYVNLRTSPRKVGEISAYSVFNPGCRRIEGTLSAEQFERELKYGATSVS